MNQIMNVAAIGINANQQPSLRKPAHAAKANLAARKDSESSFRIPRGASSNPASAGFHGLGASHEARTVRGNAGGSGSGNGQGSGNSNGGQHGKPSPRNGRKPDGNNGKGGKKRIALAVLLVAALALVGIGAWQCSKPASIDEVTGGWFYDQDSTAIQ